jgi:uncharacterized membrane protein YdjX (TVP38/TMEM64 family)
MPMRRQGQYRNRTGELHAFDFHHDRKSVPDTEMHHHDVPGAPGGFSASSGIIHYIDPYPLKNWLSLRIALQKIGLSGLFVFVLCVATMPLAAPLSLLIMAGSSAYGAPLGIVLSYVGCILNANLVYFLVRGLHLEDSWGSSRRSLRVRNAIKKNGYVLVLVFQLITIIPFMVINSAAAARV